MNQRGQALFEYISLLFLGTLMVLGIVYQFNDAFRQYLQAWLRDDESGYLFCLIQNGYLPGESSDCQVPHFDLKKGKFVAGSLGAAQGAGGAAGANGKNANGGGTGGNEGTASSLVPATSRDFAHGRGHSFSSSGTGGGAGGKGGEGAEGKGKSSTNTGSDGFSSGNVPYNGDLASNGGSSNGRGRPRTVPMSDDESGRDKKQTVNIPATERDISPGRFVSGEKGKRKVAADESFIADLSFGKIVKYIIILFISFSILFFAGSQIFAITRGRQKRS